MGLGEKRGVDGRVERLLVARKRPPLMSLEAMVAVFDGVEPLDGPGSESEKMQEGGLVERPVT